MDIILKYLFMQKPSVVMWQGLPEGYHGGGKHVENCKACCASPHCCWDFAFYIWNRRSCWRLLLDWRGMFWYLVWNMGKVAFTYFINNIAQQQFFSAFVENNAASVLHVMVKWSASSSIKKRLIGRSNFLFCNKSDRLHKLITRIRLEILLLPRSIRFFYKLSWSYNVSLHTHSTILSFGTPFIINFLLRNSYINGEIK